MTAFSNYLEAAIINHVLRGTAIFAAPGTVYVALFTGDPTDAGTGPEVTGGGYARVAVLTAGGWTAPGTDGISANVSPITWPAPTGSWGTVTHVAIFDAAAAGNMYFHGALSQSRIINSGDPALTLIAGNLTVQLQ